MTQTETETAEGGIRGRETKNPFVYFFGDGRADGTAT